MEKIINPIEDKQKKSYQKGVTLISLIITIIIMIIIAGVAIAEVVSEDGLIEKITKSIKLNEISQEKEKMELDLREIELTNRGTRPIEEVKTKLENNAIVDKVEYSEDEGYQLIIETEKKNLYKYNGEKILYIDEDDPLVQIIIGDIVFSVDWENNLANVTITTDSENSIQCQKNSIERSLG